MLVITNISPCLPIFSSSTPAPLTLIFSLFWVPAGMSMVILPLIDGISFSTGYVYSGKRGEVFSLDTISDNQCIVYGKFSDFVVLLNECGFELKDISSFSDIKEKICRGFSPVGKIEVDFEKRKSYTKK